MICARDTEASSLPARAGVQPPTPVQRARALLSPLGAPSANLRARRCQIRALALGGELTSKGPCP
jgi:hypothetical protein